MTVRLVGVSAVILLVPVFASPATAAPSSSLARIRSSLNGRGHVLHRGSRGEADVNICSTAVKAGVAHCDAHMRTDLLGKGARPLRRVPAAAQAPTNHALLGNNGAYDPAYLQSAYNAPSATNGTGQTVAIVDAFDAPNIESDLYVYRSLFGLPPCTIANGCFTKIDEHGGTNYPPPNVSWGEEISLDVQMVSAMCPNCHIMLVEAASAAFSDLGTAVNTAVARGANVVSNSYGGHEWTTEQQYDKAYFDHPGVAIVASSGDDGYGVEYPSASPDVVAVGGTSLVQETNTGSRDAIETVWTRAGGGCSAVEPKPAWQTDTGCSNRTVSDVSAVADPSTGVWMYDSTDGGWEVFGGTSVAAPIVGAIYALASNTSTTAELSSYPYANPNAFNDVINGTDGTCGGSYLCVGGPGYDGPTGLGTPNTAAFASGASNAGTLPPAPPVASADFAIGATGVTAVRAGTSANSTVTLTPENGFAGTVKLSAAVSPNTGLSARFGPSSLVVGSAAKTSTLTLAGHTGGKYTVTISATEGALVHRTTLTVSVNDFSMKVSPAKATVARGKQVHYSMTIAPSGSFSGVVRMSIAGLHSHDRVAYAHNPAAASSTQTITITTSTRDPRGTFTLRFTGTSGTLNHSVSVVLTVR